MKRRDFIKIITGLSASLASTTVFGQDVDKSKLQAFGDQMADRWVQHVEFELIPDEQIDFIDGFSNDQRCTFSQDMRIAL